MLVNSPEIKSETLSWVVAGLTAAPWIGMAILLLPLLTLAIAFKIYPTLRWLFVFIPQVCLSIFVTFQPAFDSVVLGVDLILLVFLCCDLFTLTGRRGLLVQRQMVRTGSIGGYHDVTLILENRSRRKRYVTICDDLPNTIQAEPELHELVLQPGKRIELTYKIKPSQRGSFVFEKVYFRSVSYFRFWITQFEINERTVLHVYPNMQQLGEYALLARTNRLSLIGVKKTRKIGQDNNFERLRDYTLDDNYKHIDWRSSAKRNKLTVKEFQSDQSQRVVFLLDCGRLMTNEYRGMSLLDYTLNSMLMLSYVALHQGDSVGLLCFSDRIESYVPVRGGVAQMNRLIHAGFDRFPSLRASNYSEAFLHCSKHCRKRSMVVLMTNVIDDVSGAQISGYLSTLRGRHLPLLCTLRDRAIFDFADNPHENPQVLYRSAAAAQLLLWRNDLIRKMRNSGVLAVDAFPDTLTSSLVNQYLEIKAKHLL